MKNVYPVIITKAENDYLVEIPDFDNSMTEGKSLSEAIDMARDAISLLGITMQDTNQELPSATPIHQIATENKEAIVTLVDVDFDAYRKSLENRSVKKNCTLPAWLCTKAEKAGINFSQVLQEALKERLNI